MNEKDYKTITDAHPGTIIMVRVGDYYEAYGSTAAELASILGNRTAKVCLPYNSIEKYLAEIIVAGRKVALCEAPEILS